MSSLRQHQQRHPPPLPLQPVNSGRRVHSRRASGIFNGYIRPSPPPLLRYFVSLSILLRFYHPRYSLPSRFWHRSFPSHACNTRTLPLRRTLRPLGFRHSQHIHFSPHCSFRGLSHAPLPSLSFPTFFILSLAHSSSACSMFLASFAGCLGPLWFPPLVHSFHAVFLIIRRCSALMFDRRWIFLPL